MSDDDDEKDTVVRLDKDHFKKNKASTSANKNSHPMPDGKELPSGEMFATVGCTLCSNTLFFGLSHEESGKIILLCQHCDSIVGEIHDFVAP